MMFEKRKSHTENLEEKNVTNCNEKDIFGRWPESQRDSQTPQCICYRSRKPRNSRRPARVAFMKFSGTVDWWSLPVGMYG